MIILKCKMCGGNVALSEDKTFGVCEYCGNTMTFPKVSDEQRAAIFNRGNQFRRKGEFDKALEIYESMVAEDDTDAEAHWCCALSRFGIEYVEDPETLEWFPTCHRASFDSFLDDVDYLAALRNSGGITRKQYQKDAVKIAEVQKGILAASQNEEAYDIFICYKELEPDGSRTVDSTLAQDIYYRLTDAGYRVFFSRITLEGKAGAQYEPYIFAALNSAKVMLVVGTKPEHFNAVWVKNEWGRFLALMKKDPDKLLIPCYRDMDPYRLPESLSILQSFDMEKIGFMQDLVHGVSKIVNADRDAVVMLNEKMVNMESLLKRGNMALEDKEWDKAFDFFDQVLNLDAECGEAYLGQMLAANKLSGMDDFVEAWTGKLSNVKPEVRDLNEMFSGIIDELSSKYAIMWYLTKKKLQQLLMRDFNCTTKVNSIESNYRKLQDFFTQDKLMNKAIKFAKEDLADNIASAQGKLYAFYVQMIKNAKQEEKNEIDALKEAVAGKAEELYKKAVDERETDYNNALQSMKNGNFTEAAELFRHMGDYRESLKLQAQCEALDGGRSEQTEKKDEIEQQKEAAINRRKTLSIVKKAVVIIGVILVAAVIVRFMIN